MEDIVQLLLCVATCQADIIYYPITDFRVFKQRKEVSNQYVIMTSVEEAFSPFSPLFPVLFKTSTLLTL